MPIEPQPWFATPPSGPDSEARQPLARLLGSRQRRAVLAGLGSSLGASFGAGLAAYAGSWSFAGAVSAEGLAPLNKSALTIAYPVDVPTWDPGALTIPSIQGIYETVFDSPLHFSPTTSLQARQVKAWKWLDDKRMHLQIALRDDIVFHDGSKLTMEDVRFSFLERPQANRKLMVANVFPSLIDVEIQSPTQGVLVYRRPTPTGPLSLGFLAGFVVPKAYMLQVGPEQFSVKPVGAGPYRVVDHQHGSRIILEGFDRYWGGPPAIKNVLLQISTDPASRVALLESGQAQLATQLPVRELQRLSKVSGITTKAYPYAEIYMLRIPSYVKPFDNEHVRAAMHYAINKAALSKAFYAGVAKPLSVMTPPGTPADVPDFVYPFDKARAMAELKAAGYSAENPVRFTFLTTNGTFPSDYDVARAIVQMWQEVGIVATLQTTTPPQLLEMAQGNKLPGCLLYSWANSTGDPENYAAKIFDPRVLSSTWKDMSLAPRVDALMVETDEAKRIAGYKALNQEASEHSWAIPLMQAITTVAYRSELHPVLYQSGYVLPDDYTYA